MSMEQGQQRTLLEIANDAVKQMTVFDADTTRDMVLSAAHDYLYRMYGDDLRRPEEYESAREWLTQQLYPCKDFISSADIMRVMGSELAFVCTERKPGGDLDKIRREYVNDAIYGTDPLTDPDSLSSRVTEMTKYIRTWADFPAFGFGINALDDAFGGILPGEICVLTGSPGTMKTSLALAAVDDFVSRASGLVYYCSVDMAPREISMRLMERESEIGETEIRGMLRERDPEIERIKADMLNKYNGRLVIRGHKPSQMMTLRSLIMDCLKRQPQLVIVDYLTRLKEPGQSDLEYIEAAMPEILKHAHTYETSFLILSQMSRASRSEQSAGRVGGHGRGGGLVEELAHTEIELVKQESEDGRPLIIAALTKARHGVSGQFFSLDYIGRCKKFTGDAVRMRRETRRAVRNFVSDERQGGFYSRFAG